MERRRPDGNEWSLDRKLAMRFYLEAIGTVFRDPKSGPSPGLAPIHTMELDAGSLTYTTAPLAADSELIGFPQITLWISATAKGAEFLRLPGGSEYGWPIDAVDRGA